MIRKIGIIIFILGLMIGGGGLARQSSDNKILEMGSLEVKRSRSENINWMIIAGGVMLASGILILVTRKAT